MKKITIIVLVLLAVLVVAPWGIGQLAEKRVNAGLDRIVLEAPYLSIVERNWTRGWFRSEQQVTFEVVGPWARAMNPATVLEDFKKAQAEGEASEWPPRKRPRKRRPIPSRRPRLNQRPRLSPMPTAPPEAPIPPIRFTIRNEILHGPVLWPASLGIARVNTKVDLGPEVRKKIMEVFGTDEPVRMSTRVGFLGGGTTRFYGDGRSIKLKDGGGTLAYDDYKLDISYSGNLDDIDGRRQLAAIRNFESRRQQGRGRQGDPDLDQ